MHVIPLVILALTMLLPQVVPVTAGMLAPRQLPVLVGRHIKLLQTSCWNNIQIKTMIPINCKGTNFSYINIIGTKFCISSKPCSTLCINIKVYPNKQCGVCWLCTGRRSIFQTFTTTITTYICIET